MPIADFRGLSIIIMSDKPLPDQDAMKSASRIDVTLRCDDPFIVADMLGYTDAKGLHQALCCPLTNMQRALIAHGR